MRYCGISEFFHDAGIAFLTDQGDIEFAAHSERYSKVKNDPELDHQLVSMIRKDDYTVFYDKWKNYSKEDFFSFRKEPYTPVPGSLDYNYYCNHHVSHAALGYYTRPWKSKEDTVILSVDGVGETQTMVIYDHNFNILDQRLLSKSVGIFYSAVTQKLGLKALEDEYVVMGLSSYGDPVLAKNFLDLYAELPVVEDTKVSTRRQHVRNIQQKIKGMSKKYSDKDIAASVQKFAEIKLLEYAKIARQYGSKLVYSGGVAQNVVANSLIRNLFDDMWIPTAPSDAGSSLGCAAYVYGRDTGADHINWKNPYLGYDIQKKINPKEVVDHLLEYTYCGVANGRAEFGPRALGNRSLIADVRYDVKDTVNEIKRRQKYRPFAPAILEEFANQYFEGHMNEYMQYTSKALHDYKSVTHVDGTARVQVVKRNCSSILRPILEEYYERTGVPMLLNTSLNIRGKPMVNDEHDAKLFEEAYKVKVF